jgi:hypothetical protein
MPYQATVSFENLHINPYTTLHELEQNMLQISPLPVATEWQEQTTPWNHK